MKILFIGTPDFAVLSLQKLIEAGHEIVGVVTKEDKPFGRGYKMKFSPVKEVALEKNIEVFQPTTLKDNAFLPTLEKLQPDIIVVVAYGKILPAYILEFPKYGCINVHGSLLPKYRGASPIHQSILNGESVTGITTMYMAEKLDAGDMILKDEVKIEITDTVGVLHDKLMVCGANLIVKTLELLEKGEAQRTPQDEATVTYAPLIKKEDCKIDWAKNYSEVYNHIRGLNPFPCAFTFYNGKMVKIYDVLLGEKTDDLEVGKILGYYPDFGLKVAAHGGTIYIQTMQFESSKKMSVLDILNGHAIELGDFFG